MKVAVVLLATAAAFASTPAFTAPNQLRTSVEQAVASLDAAEQDKRWYFTLTIVEEGRESVIRHDPLQERLRQRTLLRVEGDTPDKKQLRDFQKKEEKRIEDRGPAANYSYLVDLATLEQTSLKNNIAEIHFSPRIKGMEDFRDELAGKLLLDTQAKQIEKIEIFSTRAFSPAFSVTLESYQLNFTFRNENGARVLDEMISVAAGKAGFLKRFNAETRVNFSDYQAAITAAADTTE
jgi:hypothetical protein